LYIMLRDFKLPDVKAPRYRKRIHNIISNDLYKKFIAKYPEYSNKSYVEFKKAIILFNQKSWETVLEHRDGIELLENVGNIFIGSCKKLKKESIDYEKSRKYMKAVSYSNHDTDGKVGKIFYTNRNNRSRFMNREFWSFTADRNFKRATSKAFKADYKKYIEIDSSERINMLYKKAKVKDYFKQKTEKDLKVYDEFDMD